MEDNIFPFPSYRIGLHPEDLVALVVSAENGRAVKLKTSLKSQTEIGVFAHNDLIVLADIEVGDLVRYDNTRYGALVIDRLARPGERPFPRIEYRDGMVWVEKCESSLKVCQK